MTSPLSPIQQQKQRIRYKNLIKEDVHAKHTIKFYANKKLYPIYSRFIEKDSD